MSEFQRKCSIVACGMLILGVALGLAAMAIPEWIINFDHTDEPGQRYVKWGIFQRCVSTDGGPFECGMFWTSDMQPGEGDWVTGCRAMFVLGVLCAVVGAVCAVLMIVIDFKIFAFIVLIGAVAASVCSIIGIGLFIENWSKLILRYVSNRTSYGAGLWLMAVSIIMYVLASTLEAAALLMKVRKGSTSRGSSRPVFERREPSHTKGMMGSSKV